MISPEDYQALPEDRAVNGSVNLAMWRVVFWTVPEVVFRDVNLAVFRDVYNSVDDAVSETFEWGFSHD